MRLAALRRETEGRRASCAKSSGEPGPSCQNQSHSARSDWMLLLTFPLYSVFRLNDRAL